MVVCAGTAEIINTTPLAPFAFLITFDFCDVIYSVKTFLVFCVSEKLVRIYFYRQLLSFLFILEKFIIYVALKAPSLKTPCYGSHTSPLALDAIPSNQLKNNI